MTEKYRCITNKHIIPYFGEDDIRDIGLLEMEAYFNDKIETLSTNSLKDHKKIFNGIFKHAMNVTKDKRLKVFTNPAAGIVLPKEEVVRNHYNKEQLLKLLEIAHDSDIYTPIILASYLGLRRSEVMGLCWDAIDFQKKKVYIIKTMVRVRGGVIVSSNTKNEFSKRTMPLPEELEHYLKWLYSIQCQRRLLHGKPYKSDPANSFLCTSVDGETIRCDHITRAFKRIANKLTEEMGFPNMCFHGFKAYLCFAFG